MKFLSIVLSTGEIRATSNPSSVSSAAVAVYRVSSLTSDKSLSEPEAVPVPTTASGSTVVNGTEIR